MKIGTACLGITVGIALVPLTAQAAPSPQGTRLVHDAEHYLLEAQHGER